MDRGEFPRLTDAQFESVRKMVGIFGGDALRSLAFERIESFVTYVRGLIPHVQGLQAPVAEMKPAQSKPLRLKVNPYEGKEGENLHFWIREVEPAMDAALISTERLRIAFALSNLGGRAKTWAYTREATTPGCFTTSDQLLEPPSFRRIISIASASASLPVNKGSIRVLAAYLVGNPLPEHIKVTVFIDGLKVGQYRTKLFRVHGSTLEEAIQIAHQEEYNHRQARTPMSVWQDHNASAGAVQGAQATGASKGPVPMELGTAVQSSIRFNECGKLGHMQRAFPAGGQRKFPSKPRESALILGRRRTFLDARWSHGMATSMPTLGMKAKAGAGVRMDLALKIEDFDSAKVFLVLGIDKYDLILAIP
ncbi:Gag protein [Phytophthora palmivora]|uniref:Gag protein n=1 Tax=Phytophthora palmivora TaxID=4796 RepID=A0A2P4Y707_9STRA|nr:Gag protein [Phytophthora palmivora]